MGKSYSWRPGELQAGCSGSLSCPQAMVVIEQKWWKWWERRTGETFAADSFKKHFLGGQFSRAQVTGSYLLGAGEGEQRKMFNKKAEK